MKCLEEIPEIKKSVEDGKLNLTVVATAQSFFTAQAKQDKEFSLTEKTLLLKSFEGKSKREVEKQIVTLCPEMARMDKVKEISAEKTEIRITVDKKLLEKMEQLKKLLSHKLPNATYPELLDEICDLEQKTPLTFGTEGHFQDPQIKWSERKK